MSQICCLAAQPGPYLTTRGRARSLSHCPRKCSRHLETSYSEAWVWQANLLMDRSCQGVRICFTVEDIPFMVCRNKEWNESLEDDALGERAVKEP